MKPILNHLYVWDGNKVFDKLSVKNHPSGHRYAMNAEIDGITKTFILITKDKLSDEKVIGYFNKSVTLIKSKNDALRVFKAKTGDSPVLLSVPSI